MISTWSEEGSVEDGERRPREERDRRGSVDGRREEESGS